MPAPVVSQISARPVAKGATPKPRAAGPPKKRRVMRRRGRGRGELDSDDEIEREAATDSDSNDDGSSSLDSATDDSDTEPASEDVILDRTHLPTPRNSKSPETVVKDEEVNRVVGVSSFFVATGDWSEMVTDEKTHGAADLPVIDFTDFSGQSVPSAVPNRKQKKAKKAKRPRESLPTPAESASKAPVDASAEAEPELRPSRPSNRPSSQSARLAYQHKLETDPSYVPTIGDFWGHDDRLIDAELRSLSGWWRGRGRGRGRGFIRGRGGFQGPLSRPGKVEDSFVKSEDLPPIERTWTHDGFEDMRRREEQRRAEQAAARNDQSSPKRGGITGRGRGRGNFSRGSFASPTTKPHNATSAAGRVRFVMKPELVWTKQHEAFLYFDATSKPRYGQGVGYRVHIPGHSSVLVRVPSTQRALPAVSSKAAAEEGEAREKYFQVRLPKGGPKENHRVVETPLDEVFTVRLQLAPAEHSSIPEPASITVETSSESEGPVQVVLEPAIRSQLEQLSAEPHVPNPERQAKMEEAVLRHPNTEAVSESNETSTIERPVLPPLQTAFTPPPPPPPQPMSRESPVYGSPYNYHLQLPPGVALNQHGLPYEVATGHPVYLQPPPPMYNPRPLMPSHFTPGVPFAPRHVHHTSAVSPDFMSQPASHTPPIPPMNGFIDPATGTPIFSFPRQTTRIEIRAPTVEDPISGKTKSTPRISSGLRTTAPTFQPSRSSTLENNYYQSSNSSEPTYDNINGPANEDVNQPAMMMYPPYQQPYYYPEPYGYPQYVDMSGQYDMYTMDQIPQGTVYY